MDLDFVKKKKVFIFNSFLSYIQQCTIANDYPLFTSNYHIWCSPGVCHRTCFFFQYIAFQRSLVGDYTCMYITVLQTNMSLPQLDPLGEDMEYETHDGVNALDAVLLPIHLLSSLSRAERIAVGHRLDDMLLSCTFGGETCYAK